MKYIYKANQCTDSADVENAIKEYIDGDGSVSSDRLYNLTK